MIYPNKYGLVLCLSVLGLFVQANSNPLDTLPEVARTETVAYERHFSGTKNTYNDFDTQKKADEYLVYPSSPIQFFLGTNLWHDLYVNLKANELPALVNEYSIAVLPKNNWPDLVVGYYSTGMISMQLQYYNRALEEHIFAQTPAGSPYAVERELVLKGFNLAIARDINILRLTKQIYLGGAVGFEISRVNASFGGTSSFRFDDRESLETILGNTIAINLDDNQVGVNMEQQLFLVSSVATSLFWQLGVDIQVNDKWTIFLKANNLIPLNFFLKTQKSYIETPDEAWGENFELQYNFIELKNRTIQLSLSYRVSEADRSKQKLKLY